MLASSAAASSTLRSQAVLEVAPAPLGCYTGRGGPGQPPLCPELHGLLPGAGRGHLWGWMWLVSLWSLTQGEWSARSEYTLSLCLAPCHLWFLFPGVGTVERGQHGWLGTRLAPPLEMSKAMAVELLSSSRDFHKLEGQLQ